MADTTQEPAQGDYIRAPLKEGMCGEDIKALQENLNKLGISDGRGRPLREDGYFGPGTAEAVRALRIELEARDYDRAIHEGLGREYSKEALTEAAKQWPPQVGFGDWRDMEELMRQEGLQVSRPGNAAEPRFRWGDTPEAPVPPPRQDGPLGCDLVSDNGGAAVVASTALPDHALYHAIRGQLPESVSDAKAAEAAVRAMEAGIRHPSQLRVAMVHDNQVFVASTVPGFRASVDLSQPAPPMAELGERLASLSAAQQGQAQQAMSHTR